MTKRAANIFAFWAFVIAVLFGVQTWNLAGEDAPWSSILTVAVPAVAFFLSGVSFLVGWRTK